MTDPFEGISRKYEILEKLSEGGMGTIYKVRHRLLDEVRVIKILRPELVGDEDFQNRFLVEARTAIQLRHKNLAMLYDCTIDGEGHAFMALEYIEGRTFANLKRVSPALGIELAFQALEAIRYLHRKGIVHRDISPDNLMVTLDDMGSPLVKLIDLGIAKNLRHDSGLTQTGVLVGKFRYSAPELFTSGSKNADESCDIYSFGVVFYELLTNMHPIPGNQPASIIAAHLHRPPLSFDVSDPEGRIDSGLRAVVLRALEKDPRKRFADAANFQTALKAAAGAYPPFSRKELQDILDLSPVGGRKNEQSSHTTQGIDTQRLDRGKQKTEQTTATRRQQIHPEAEARIESLVDEAKIHIEAGRVEEAGRALRMLLRVKPGHERARKLLEGIETPGPESRGVGGQDGIPVPKINLQPGDLALPPFQLPLRWRSGELPRIANQGFSLPEAPFEFRIETTFRVNRTRDLLALAMAELFCCNNVASLDTVEIWLDMNIRRQGSGVLQTTFTCRPLDPGISSPSRKTKNQMTQEMNNVLIRSLRPIKHAVYPASQLEMRFPRREVGFRTLSAPSFLHICGWLLPRTGGRFQEAELFLRSSGRSLSGQIRKKDYPAGHLAILHKDEILILAINLEILQQKWPY